MRLPTTERLTESLLIGMYVYNIYRRVGPWMKLAAAYREITTPIDTFPIFVVGTASVASYRSCAATPRTHGVQGEHLQPANQEPGTGHVTPPANQERAGESRVSRKKPARLELAHTRRGKRLENTWQVDAGETEASGRPGLPDRNMDSTAPV